MRNSITVDCTQCAGTGKMTVSPLELLMQREHMTQTQLAGHLGVAQGTVSHMLATHNIVWKYRSQICKVFKVTPEQLAGRAPLDAPKPARKKKAKP